MKRLIRLLMVSLLVFSVFVTPVMASETTGVEVCEDGHDFVDGVCAICGEREARTAGPLGYVVIIIAAIVLSTLRPIMMSRRLRKNYDDGRVWGLDKYGKF